jgi:peptide-methionine (S)-S-oxide reductase
MSTRILVGAGCFWTVQAHYQFLHGVTDTRVGYVHIPWWGEPPSVEGQPSSQARERVEVVEMTVDWERLPLARFLDVFWSVHTPTLVPADQFTDSSTCRSVLICDDPTVRQALEEAVAAHALTLDAPIQTRVWPAAAFAPASEPDQEFYLKNPREGYCRQNIVPRLDRLWHTMPEQFDLME